MDELAAAEAEAGAKLGGAGFLALNVLNEGVAHAALLTKLERRQGAQPARPQAVGRGRARAEGFVDRETVAQAAANAVP